MTFSGKKISDFARFGKKIIGIGSNYRQTVKELGFCIPEEPLVFYKLPISYITKGQQIKFPPNCKELWYEVELGIVIGKDGYKIPENESLNYIAGYTCALDITNWTFIKDAIEKRQPWCIGKGFETSCPVGDFVSKDFIPDPHDVNIWLKRNGELKQNQHTNDMIVKVPKIVSYVSAFMTLEAGDLILTGSPPGYGCVESKDILKAGIKDSSGSAITEIEFTVA